ncbi:MAG: hypothetical protein IJ385_01980 [Ruminiclostridium sp.]|nr:hypothetical protein [Ruminiclostridium sp.]
MEWSKSAMSKAELEKKQREFMEQAVRMAKKAGQGEEKKAEAAVAAPDVELPAETTAQEVEIIEEIEEAAEEIVEELAEVFTAEDIAVEPPVAEEEKPAEEEPVREEHAEETSYGVFDADELARAIEKGEVSGEGLRQAAEMLAEMTRKTEEMKKLIKEQEKKSEKHVSGGDIGLNSYIDRHNKGCRGCSDGKHASP